LTWIFAEARAAHDERATMASRSSRVGGRNPEQAGQAAWLATEKVVRVSASGEWEREREE